MPRRWLDTGGAAVLALVMGIATGLAPCRACDLKDAETRTVIRILDGDTLLLDGGVEARLIGALAPRSWDAGSEGEAWPLADLAKAELERMVAGRSVELAFAGRRVDRYGRLLAQVFVHQGGRETAAPTWVQGEMLKRGLARAYSLDGSALCLGELLIHERMAFEATIGVWALAAYAVRGAQEVDDLLQRRGTFQIVEGRVRAVSDVRGTTFVNFGEDVRQDFTVSMRSAVRRKMGVLDADPQQWPGRTVRVRGWIERRGGPLIEIHDLAQIQVSENDPVGGATQIDPGARPEPSRRRPGGASARN